MQWRARPDGEWKYHSVTDADVASDQMTAYHSRYGDRRIFDYRAVDPGSQDAIEKAADPVYLVMDRGSFQFNR